MSVAESLPVRPAARSPFRPVAPTLAVAVAYAVAAVVWVVAGGVLPGGRWLAVHLFTLGVLTNLVLVFTEHFGRTLTRRPDRSTAWQAVATNVSVLVVLVGLPTSTRWAVAVGATGVTAVVLVSYWRLRGMRRAAVGARFTWVVRAYERAHGAFVHGAVLGLLIGTGVVTGAWYASARIAHLHVNLLGWGGLTLLATIVFFGPTLVRTRIEDGADDRAARALRHGATGITVGVLLLLATGVGGALGTTARVVAAIALGVFAWAAAVTCLAVGRAALRAKPSATRWPVVAVAAWFPVVAWADVAVVAGAAWRWLDVLGLVLVLGVLGQAMLATLVYLAPMLRWSTATGRERLRTRLDRGASPRAGAWNLGVSLVAAAAMVRGDVGAVGARTGWVLLAGVLAWLLVAGLAPVQAADSAAKS